MASEVRSRSVPIAITENEKEAKMMHREIYDSNIDGIESSSYERQAS